MARSCPLACESAPLTGTAHLNGFRTRQQVRVALGCGASQGDGATPRWPLRPGGAPPAHRLRVRQGPGARRRPHGPPRLPTPRYGGGLWPTARLTSPPRTARPLSRGQRGKELHRCSVATTPRGAMAASDSRDRRGKQNRENSVTLRTGDYQIGPRQRWRAATPPSGDCVMPQRFSWMHPSSQVMISPDQVAKNSPVLGYRRTNGSLSLPCHGQEMVSVW